MHIDVFDAKAAYKSDVGASVAQWSVRSPFTSEVAGSILSENFLNVTRSQCSTHVKRVGQHSAESRGFSPGTAVSSHRDVPVDRLNLAITKATVDRLK